MIKICLFFILGFGIVGASIFGYEKYIDHQKNVVKSEFVKAKESIDSYYSEDKNETSEKTTHDKEEPIVIKDSKVSPKKEYWVVFGTFKTLKYLNLGFSTAKENKIPYKVEKYGKSQRLSLGPLSQKDASDLKNQNWIPKDSFIVYGK